MRWLAGLGLAVSCHWAVEATPSSHVYRGPAYAAAPRVLAALPVDCRNCTGRQLDAVAMQTRMGLELAGYNVVDTELVNAEARMRFTLTKQAAAGTDNARTHEEITDVPEWSRLPPGQQQQLLVALGVDGVLQAAITMGYSNGAQYQQTVTMRLAVARLDGTIAWTADCGMLTNGDDATAAMIERVGRCALDSEAAW